MSGPPRARGTGRSAPGSRSAPGAATLRPLGDAELEQLETLLEQVPAPHEALDASMLDGFLCGVLVQPRRVPDDRWLPFVTDTDGRALPSGSHLTTLHGLVRRRYAELDAAIEQRQWFDPWVFELEADAGAHAEVARGQDEEDDDSGSPPEVDAVYPWVAGFVTALEQFPALMQMQGPALDDALLLLYRHLDPQDLEDADELLETIEGLEPPENLAVAVEELVRATLLLADIGRPRLAAAQRPPPARGAQRRPPPRR